MIRLPSGPRGAIHPKLGPPIILSQARTAAALVPVTYADAAYYPTTTPTYAGSTATLGATYTGGANNVACAFFHYDSAATISGVTFDGSAASFVIVSSGTNPSGIVAYAPCSSSGTHTWVVTFGAAAPTVQGTTLTMIGVKPTPSQTAVQSWGNHSPTTTGSIAVSAYGMAMTFLGTVDTTGTWSGATAISTGSGNFPLAYSTSSATVSYSGISNGSQMATLSWDAADSSSGGTVWQFVSAVSESWSETSLTFDRTRAFVSAAAEAWAESSALSRLRGVVSSATQAWTETAQFGRIRAFTSSVAAAWAESSTLTRIRALASSVVATAWSEASSLVRIRGFVAANGATWAETSSLIRTRGFSSACGSVWSETATFSRTRRFVSSATAVWGELSTFAAGTIIQLTATGGFVWSETGNAPVRKRGFVATSGSAWVEAAALSRRAGLVSTSGAVWSEAAALSRKLALAGNGQMAWGGSFNTVGILALLHAQAMMLFGQQSQFTGGIFRIYGPVVKFTFEVNPFPPPARDEDRPINF